MIRFTLVMGLAAIAMGCGGGAMNQTGFGGGTGSQSQSTSFECCINGAHYTCPNQDALDRCGNFSSPDPSQCTRDSKSCGSSSFGGGTGKSTGGGSGSGTGGGSGSSSLQSIGQQCQFNDDCASNACLTNTGDTFGYCTRVCQSFADCPSFWDCEKVGNASSKYCVQ